MTDLPQKGALQEAFAATCGTLYHCIPGPLRGGAIEISDKYGTTIPHEVLEKLGVVQEIPAAKKAKLVFAAKRMSMSLAYAFDYHADEILMNMGINGTDAELALVINSDVTLAKPRDARVFAFPASGFVVLPGARQAVSAAAVAVGDKDIVLHAKSADDLMRAGLQIISMKESFAAPGTANEFWREAGELKLSHEHMIKHLIAEGRATWENHTRNINPDTVLAKHLGIALLQQARSSPRIT